MSYWWFLTAKHYIFYCHSCNKAVEHFLSLWWLNLLIEIMLVNHRIKTRFVLSLMLQSDASLSFFILVLVYLWQNVRSTDSSTQRYYPDNQLIIFSCNYCGMMRVKIHRTWETVGYFIAAVQDQGLLSLWAAPALDLSSIYIHELDFRPALTAN